MTRHVLDRAVLRSGAGAGAELDLVWHARPQPWALDLEREALRLLRCEQRRAVFRSVATGKLVARALGCTSRICPVCQRSRANRATHRWLAVHEAAAADGAELWHTTYTMPWLAPPASEDAPGLITPQEAARGWRGTLAAPGVVGRPVGGETLEANYTRFSEGFRDVRQGRGPGCRDSWEGLGLLRGIEYTGRDGPCKPKSPERRYRRCRDGTCGHTNRPRWHTHGHCLIVVPDPRREGFLETMQRAWCRRMGSSMAAQHARRCDPGAVREVLKYPFKPASLTAAQRIETLVYARGMKPHHQAGAWHPRARARREDPRWERWLSARPEPEPSQRLHLLEPDLGPRLYTGQVTEGLHRWTWDPSGVDAFEARAEQFAHLVGKRVGDYLEPGADMEIALDVEREPGDDDDDPDLLV